MIPNLGLHFLPLNGGQGGRFKEIICESQTFAKLKSSFEMVETLYIYIYIYIIPRAFL